MKIYRKGKLVKYDFQKSDENKYMKIDLNSKKIQEMTFEIREPPKNSRIVIGSIINLNGVDHIVSKISKDGTLTLKEENK